MFDPRLTPEIITVYGTSWCPDCKRSKHFLEAQAVQYNFIDIETDPQAAAFVNKTNHGVLSTPTIVFPDGSILVEPSNGQLALRLAAVSRARPVTIPAASASTPQPGINEKRLA